MPEQVGGDRERFEMIDAHRDSYIHLQTERRDPAARARIVAQFSFRVQPPGARQPAPRNGNVSDPVELSAVRPDLIGLPHPALPPLAAERAAPLGFSRQTGDLGNEKRRNADPGDEGALDKADAADDEEGGERIKPGETADAQGKPLDERKQREVAELKRRDIEVRRHEQAHKSVGGRHAGAISYDYRQGPDGKRYAVGGEVSIDVSKEKDPEVTAAKMRQVRAAALAPADPSGQDLRVAAEAARIENEVRREMGRERAEAPSGETAGIPADGQSNGESENNVFGSASPADAGGRDSGSAPSFTRLSEGMAMVGLAPIPSFGLRAVDVYA